MTIRDTRIVRHRYRRNRGVDVDTEESCDLQTEKTKREITRSILKNFRFSSEWLNEGGLSAACSRLEAEGVSLSEAKKFGALEKSVRNALYNTCLMISRREGEKYREALGVLLQAAQELLGYSKAEVLAMAEEGFVGLFHVDPKKAEQIYQEAQLGGEEELLKLKLEGANAYAQSYVMQCFHRGIVRRRRFYVQIPNYLNPESFSLDKVLARYELGDDEKEVVRYRLLAKELLGRKEKMATKKLLEPTITTEQLKDALLVELSRKSDPDFSLIIKLAREGIIPKESLQEDKIRKHVYKFLIQSVNAMFEKAMQNEAETAIADFTFLYEGSKEFEQQIGLRLGERLFDRAKNYNSIDQIDTHLLSEIVQIAILDRFLEASEDDHMLLKNILQIFPKQAIGKLLKGEKRIGQTRRIMVAYATTTFSISDFLAGIDYHFDKDSIDYSEFKEILSGRLLKLAVEEEEGQLALNEVFALFEYSPIEQVDAICRRADDLLDLGEVGQEVFEVLAIRDVSIEDYMKRKGVKKKIRFLYMQSVVRDTEEQCKILEDRFFAKETMAQANDETGSVIQFYQNNTIPLSVRKAIETFADIDWCEEEIFSLKERSARLTHYLSPREYREIKAKNPTVIEGADGSPDFDGIASELNDEMNRVNEDSSIISLFSKGLEVFGAKTMLKYMSRPDMSHHDALHNFDVILKLFKKSGLSEKAFASNILFQVARDNSVRDGRNAHLFFNDVASSLANLDFAKLLHEAKQYDNVQEFQELISNFLGKETNAFAFEKWENLIMLYNLNEMIVNKTVLISLSTGAYSPAMERFARKVAFSIGSRTDLVVQLLEDPGRFFNLGDAHDADGVHEPKKPSNYLTLPHLGMAAVDLREALVGGALESIQHLPPMERTYRLSRESVKDSQEEISQKQLHADLVHCMGRRGDGLKPHAANFKDAFRECRSFCSKHEVNLRSLLSELQGKSIIAGFSEKQLAELRSVVYLGNGNAYGVHRQEKVVPVDEYRIKIGRKGDPEMVVAGNNTNSCMPFGSGKQNIYMCNPNCVQLVLQRKTADGYKTAAQSVMTLGLDIKKNRDEAQRDYLNKGKKLRELISGDVFSGIGVLTCDNIEIDKGEEGSRHGQIIESYQRFFSEYLAKYAQALQVVPNEVAVGEGYTDINSKALSVVPNSIVPFAPLGYTDNKHENRFSLAVESGASVSPEKKERVLPMSTKDVLAVAYLESKAYQDNDELAYHLHLMQNSIIGMDIANAYFDRPNLSLVHRDDKGVPDGYLLAYEGVSENDDSLVFVSDIAVDPSRRRQGISAELMHGFLKAYAGAYGAEGRSYLPVYANLREDTSYKI